MLLLWAKVIQAKVVCKDRSRWHSLCRLCPHVVVVVGCEHFSDLWGYAVEPLMRDRPKVRFRTKRDTGVNAVREVASRTRLLIRRGVTPEEDPTSLKKAKLESAQGRVRIPGQLSTRATGTVQTRCRGPGTRCN